MNYNFEYIDIILLAMIAGFIFLRLRTILGKRTGHEENMDTNFAKEFPSKKITEDNLNKINFSENEKNDFLKGAKIAYETIITNFAKGNLKDIKHLLDTNIFDEFKESLNDKKNKGHISETTFIGVNSATIKNFERKDNIIEVTVDFVSEIISSIKDKNNKILTGDPKKVKKVHDTWKFSRNAKSNNPNWILIDTQT